MLNPGVLAAVMDGCRGAPHEETSSFSSGVVVQEKSTWIHDSESGFGGRMPATGPIILFKGWVWSSSRHQLGQKTSVVLDFAATSGDVGLNIEFTWRSDNGKTPCKSG
jgi:hypothetical protein